MSIGTFMLLINGCILLVALGVCIRLRLSNIRRAHAFICSVGILTLILLIALNKPKSGGGHDYSCGCLAGGVPLNLRSEKKSLLRYTQENYPDVQILSSSDIRKTLESSPSIEYKIEKYALHTTKDAWWLGYDIAELHQKSYSVDVAPYTLREKLLAFFGIEQDLRHNIRQELRGTAEYYETSPTSPRLLGTDSLDHPPLSDDLKGLYQPQDNVVWIRVK